ncbi:MAG: hypothetical protein U0736_14815 [Gemmataceae bacterium]
MTESDWFDEYERAAWAAGDGDRVQLAGYHRAAYQYRESDPDRALTLLDEGRRLADQLNEPWWGLFYRQYRVHALLHFKADYRDVLDLAVHNTLELRKPAFTHFPRRLMVHGDLVSADLGIDPVGYAEVIERAARLPRRGDSADRGRPLSAARRAAAVRPAAGTARPGRAAHRPLAGAGGGRPGQWAGAALPGVHLRRDVRDRRAARRPAGAGASGRGGGGGGAAGGSPGGAGRVSAVARADGAAPGRRGGGRPAVPLGGGPAAAPAHAAGRLLSRC